VELKGFKVIPFIVELWLPDLNVTSQISYFLPHQLSFVLHDNVLLEVSFTSSLILTMLLADVPINYI